MIFCSYCGKQLEDGARCNCQASIDATYNQRLYNQQPYGDQQYNQQYNQPYSNQQQYGQPARNDDALGALICGILSFFFGGVILSIVAICLANSWKKRHGGVDCQNSRAGRICGIISLVLYIVTIAALIVFISIVESNGGFDFSNYIRY